jgi:glycosyltransferase involved in cell wall biosynthesis
MSHRYAASVSAGRLRLLAISEHGSRTGGPVVLRSLLRWLSEQRPWPTTALFGSGGPVADDVAPWVDRVLLDSIGWRRAERWAGGPVKAPGRAVAAGHRASLRRRAGDHDVVFVNSVSTGRLAAPFLAGPAPVVVYVHELGEMFAAFADRARPLLARGDHFIAASDGVRSMLVKGLGVDAGRVTTVSPAPEREALAPRDCGVVAAVLDRHRPAGHLVGAFGWIGEMKGTDRFVEVARRVIARLPGEGGAVRFLWVGSGTDRRRAELAASIRSAGLDGAFELVPATADIHAYYRACDVVLVTSREEALSMVALEAAAAGTPVLCFSDCSGPVELSRTGVTVPCADVDAMAQLVLELLADAGRRGRLGREAAEAIGRDHHPDRAPAAVAEVIEQARGRR